MANTIKGFNTKNGVAQYDYNALANRPEDGTGTIISPNADYAEVGEWEDGNPASEDRLGYFVAIAAVEDNTIKIRKATSQDDVKGVTVFNPAFSGNATAEKYVSAGVLYPQYSYVGLMGIVSVIDNGTCTVGGRCMPADDGTAVPSSNNMGYGVLKRINASHVLIAVEPGADMIQRIKGDIEGIENKLENNIEANRKTTAAVSSLAAQTEKRVTNLEAAVYGDLAQENEDNSLAYVKDVPQNALPFAEVKAIGGMTRKCTQLIPYPYLSTLSEVNGVSVTNHENGTITFSGKCNSGWTFILCEQLMSAGSYYLHDGTTKEGVNFLAYDMENNTVLSWEGAFSLIKNTYVRVYYLIADTFDGNVTVCPMLNLGTTALPYEPYFEGLRSSPVTEIESVGVNLFSGGDLDFVQSKLITLDNPLSAGTYVLSCVCTSTDTGYSYNSVSFVGGASGGRANVNVAIPRNTPQVKTVTLDSPVSEIRFNASDSYSASAGYSATFTKIMLNKGATALPYAPYVKHTLPIPEAVQALDGYSEGIDNSYQNVLDLEKPRYIQWVRRLSQNEKQLKAVTDFSYSNIVYYQLPKTGTADKGKTTTNILVSNFPIYTKTLGDWNNADRIGTVTGASTYDWYWFGFPIGTTLEQAQSVINDCDIVVTLSEAKFTDISDILPTDNLIGVEGGGTLTFKNEYGYDVPSEVTFVTKGASA